MANSTTESTIREKKKTSEQQKQRHGDEFIGTKRCRKIAFFSFSLLHLASVDCFVHSIYYFSSHSFAIVPRHSTMKAKKEKKKKKKIAVKLWNPGKYVRTRRSHMQKIWFELAFWLLLLRFATSILASVESLGTCSRLWWWRLFNIKYMRPLPSAVFRFSFTIFTFIPHVSEGNRSSSSIAVERVLLRFASSRHVSLLFPPVSFIRSLSASTRSLPISCRQSKWRSRRKKKATNSGHRLTYYRPTRQKETIEKKFQQERRKKNGLHSNMEQQRIQRDLFCLQSSNTFGALLIHFSRPSVRRLDHWHATMCAWLCARVMPCCACAWINMLPLCGKLTFHIVSFAYRNEMK